MAEKKSGDDYLLCQEKGCLWNADRFQEETDTADELIVAPGDNGLRICRYDSRAIILGLPVPANCPYKSRVYEIIRLEAAKNPIPPTEMLKKVNDYIRLRANEARSRLGLSTINSV